MTDLADFTGLVARDHGLAVVSTLRPDATISSSRSHASPGSSATPSQSITACSDAPRIANAPLKRLHEVNAKSDVSPPGGVSIVRP